MTKDESVQSTFRKDYSASQLGICCLTYLFPAKTEPKFLSQAHA